MSNARVVEIYQDTDGFSRAAIQCPPHLVPSPGAFVTAVKPQSPDEPLPISLFSCGYAQSLKGFVAAPLSPESLQPGDDILLGGPFGHGFTSISGNTHLALAAFGPHCARLLPLATLALNSGGAVALFTDAPLPRLSPNIEARPLSDLPDSIAWADHLAMDATLAALLELPASLRNAIPAHAEVLLETPLPCAGMADCGICAVPVKRNKWAHACSAGPVFVYGELNLQ